MLIMHFFICLTDFDKAELFSVHLEKNMISRRLNRSRTKVEECRKYVPLFLIISNLFIKTQYHLTLHRSQTQTLFSVQQMLFKNKPKHPFQKKDL